MPKRSRESNTPAPTPAPWLLVTGQPGSGKTTLVRSVLEAVTSKAAVADVHVQGFYTDEVLDGSTRVGFDLITIPDGKRDVLSRKQGLPSHFPKTGSYSVDVASFEALALPTLCPPTSCSNSRCLIVIDEIGRMELHSSRFQAAVERLLTEYPDWIVFGAVTAPIYGHRVPFCDRVTCDARVSVERITKKTRDDVRAAMEQRLLCELGAR